MFGIKTARAQAANAQTQMVLAHAEAGAAKANADYAAQCATDASWELFKLRRDVQRLEMFTMAGLLILALAIRALANADGE
jgi:hypothetical protein